MCMNVLIQIKIFPRVVFHEVFGNHNSKNNKIHQK
ncbi:unnamed protein product [Trichobilharzia regenti]|nr:unnamed protein product [Trichobilharzia regenti]